MDIRIVNTCNNDCIYCLEQSLRKKKKFHDIESISSEIKSHRDKYPQDNILSFYGGNPLLHPDLEEIITIGKQSGFKSISLLTNTFGVSKEKLISLQKAGLTGISFYFHSFNEQTHTSVVGTGISLSSLKKNISSIVSSKLSITCIIHLHLQNITTIHKDILELYKKHKIVKFEIIRYRLVSRAKTQFSNLLEIPYEIEKKYISYIRKIPELTDVKIRFVHFKNQ